MIGLYNKPGRGCKSKFNPEQEEKIKELVKQEPRQLNQVLQKVKEEWGIISSKKTIQRILKTLKMSWHRMRRGIGGEPPAQISCYAFTFFARKPYYKDSRLQNIRFSCVTAYGRRFNAPKTQSRRK